MQKKLKHKLMLPGFALILSTSFLNPSVFAADNSNKPPQSDTTQTSDSNQNNNNQNNTDNTTNDSNNNEPSTDDKKDTSQPSDSNQDDSNPSNQDQNNPNNNTSDGSKDDNQNSGQDDGSNSNDNSDSNGGSADNNDNPGNQDGQDQTDNGQDKPNDDKNDGADGNQDSNSNQDKPGSKPDDKDNNDNGTTDGNNSNQNGQDKPNGSNNTDKPGSNQNDGNSNRQPGSGQNNHQPSKPGNHQPPTNHGHQSSQDGNSQYPGVDNSTHQTNGPGSTHQGQPNYQRPNHWQNTNNQNIKNDQYQNSNHNSVQLMPRYDSQNQVLGPVRKSNSHYQSQSNTLNYDSNRFMWQRPDTIFNNQKGFEHTSNQQSLIRRFNSLAEGSYKYNPFVINQIHRLDNSNGAVSDKDIYNIFRKETFSGNQYLNSLQQSSNYFRFQYFNPLDSKKYYKNLDDQVLALITGDIGSMPDLKKPEDKESSDKSAFKNHSDDKISTSNQQKESYQKEQKTNRLLMTLGRSMVAIFIGVIIAFLLKRRKHDEGAQ